MSDTSKLCLSVRPDYEPAQLTAIERLANQFNRALDNPLGQTGLVGPSGLLEQIGSQLWAISKLDADDLRRQLEAARDAERPLQLVLTGDETLHLPWELLHHPHPELGFLARHASCALLRRIRGDGTKQPQARPRPLKLLLFVASPEDLAAESGLLDFEHEEELLYTALDRPITRGDVEIDVPEDGCLSTLRERLHENTYHGVILSMHGAQAQDAAGQPEWGLLFEDEATGTKAPVAGSRLAELFEELPGGRRPGLVVLSACRSATPEESGDSISSVARQLHRVGVERVLGMRLSVQDRAASEFSAALFEKLAHGESVGRAVNLARRRMATSGWWSPEEQTQGDEPTAQWTIPVLLDRTRGGPLVDLEAPADVRPRPKLPVAMPGDGSLSFPSRSEFIGRRKQIRLYLRKFLEGETPKLLFVGAGGVGKTTLAGLFARRLCERLPEVLLLGLQAPFDLARVEEVLRSAAESHNVNLEPAHDKTDRRDRLQTMLQLLASRPLALLLDNLESLQELETLAFTPDADDGRWLVETVCALPPSVRVILTGRYTLPEIDVQTCPVTQAPWGDVLKRMSRLHWPADWSAAQKRGLYETLGGNHRALEWTSHLIHNRTPDDAQELLAALQRVDVAPETPEQTTAVVREAMRHDLLLERLAASLPASARRLLERATLYRTAVIEDGLQMIDAESTTHAADRRALVDRGLLEQSHVPQFDVDVFEVPPVVRELLQAELSEADRADLHRRMGDYHRRMGSRITRRWTDYLEAVHHFRAAGCHTEADALAEPLCDMYYRTGNRAAALALTAAITTRDKPAVPWWAWNRQGMCLHALGSLESALACFEPALNCAPDEQSRGTTLNNISQIYSARGEYDRALVYLEQSLAIQREIGNRAGESATLNNLATTAHARGDYARGMQYLEQSLAILRKIGNRASESATLNNIGETYRARGDYERALDYLEQSLVIRREIGDRAGEGTTLSNISQTYSARGDYERALEYLEQSLAIQRKIGDRSGEGVTLNNISQIYKARGDYERALDYLEQSLAIFREIGDRSREGTALNNLATTAHARGDYERALECLEQSRAIKQEIGDRAGMIPTLHNMALIAVRNSNPKRAVDYWQEALQLALDTGNAQGIFHVAGALGQRAGSAELLELAISTGKQAGFPGVEEL